jgi:thiamine pyrophosphokinase
VQGTSSGPARTALLHFEVPLAIVGGGRVDPAALRELQQLGAEVVGADGGADVALAAGVLPAAVIGDMDSLDDPSAWEKRTRLVTVSEQETTDLEKALYLTRAPVTVLLGATGGRLDHSLAAIDALARYGQNRRIILCDESDVALTLGGPFDFAVEPGDRIGIHALQPVRFTASEGLRWPLSGLLLSPGERQGASNAATAGPFSLTPGEGERGVWLLIVAARYLARLLRRAMESGEG